MSDLQQLASEDRAVLSLVIARSMSFEQIGSLLRMDPGVVRERAHAAAVQLAGAPDGADPRVRERILDFVLGQRPAADVRDDLRLPTMRQWTISLTNALAPLARHERPGVSMGAEPALRPEASVAPLATNRLQLRLRRHRVPLAALATAAATIVIVGATSSDSTIAPTGAPAQGPVPSVQVVRRLVFGPTTVAREA